MAAAHRLVEKTGCKVIVIERNPSCGGLARSARTDDGKHTEYCWHMINRAYKTLPGILKEIPDGNGKQVFDHLRPLRQYKFFKTNEDPIVHKNTNFLTDWMNFFPKLGRLTGKSHISDMPKTLFKLLRTRFLSRGELEKFDDITWDDFNKDLSDEMRNWIIESTSIYLGMDYKKVSAHALLDLIYKDASLSFDSSADFFAFDGPMNEVWFDPWQRSLEKQGVKFLMETSVVQILHTAGKIDGIVYKEKTGQEDFLKVDYLINSMGIECLSGLYPLNSDFPTLNELSTQVQTQVLFRFGSRLPEDDTTCYIWGSSPWFIMGRLEGGFWNLEKEDYISVGIGKWDTAGFNGKTALECTEEELAEECWNQMTKNGSPFEGEMPEWNIWQSFKFDPKTQKMTTWEPKFSNNVGTLKLRPFTDDELFPNLKHATAYTRTEMNLFNMDSAAEAGVMAAQKIVEELDDETNIRPANVEQTECKSEVNLERTL